MAKNKLSDKDKATIIELNKIDPVKYTKYRLAIMYGVTWGTIHYVFNEPARLRNIELTKQRNKAKRKESN